jgi:2-polyprenyl-3-methyl-5-hydroxy-6-metoxy-1,4-benzoquinol methylase
MSRWTHSSAPRGDDYDARWQQLAASGQNPHGEADFVSSFAPQTVLDAGCGTGRVAIELARRGVRTVGVDLDPGMLETARLKAPDLEWVLTDLASLALVDESGAQRCFDVVAAPGNVMIFVEPGTEATVVARCAAHVAPGGRLIAGFQLGRLALDDYDRFAVAAGLRLDARFATWDGEPFTAAADYAVSVHVRPGRG